MENYMNDKNKLTGTPQQTFYQGNNPNFKFES